MTQYMLDTNICIELIRNRSAKILRRLSACPIGSVGISVITLAELEHGVEKSAFPERNRIALASFCAPLEIYPFDHKAAFHYGRIRAALERKGKTIGPFDTLIAAHSLAMGTVLVTNNVREFRRVEGLVVENWVA